MTGISSAWSRCGSRCASSSKPWRESPNPYRYRVRPPSFVNLQALELMCRGAMVADVIAVIGTLDIVLGEVDR